MEKLEEIFFFLGLLKAESTSEEPFRGWYLHCIQLPLRHLTTSIGVAVLAVS